MPIRGLTGEASGIVEGAQSDAYILRRKDKGAVTEAIHLFRKIIFSPDSAGCKFLEAIWLDAASADDSYTAPPHIPHMLARTTVEVGGKTYQVPLPEPIILERMKTVYTVLNQEIENNFPRKNYPPNGPTPRLHETLLPSIDRVRGARGEREASSLTVVEATLDDGAVRDLLVKLGTSYETVGVVMDKHRHLLQLFDQARAAAVQASTTGS